MRSNRPHTGAAIASKMIAAQAKASAVQPNEVAKKPPLAEPTPAIAISGSSTTTAGRHVPARATALIRLPHGVSAGSAGTCAGFSSVSRKLCSARCSATSTAFVRKSSSSPICRAVKSAP